MKNMSISFLFATSLLTSCTSYEKRPDLTQAVKPWQQGQQNAKEKTSLRNATHKSSLNKKAKAEQEVYLLKALETANDNELKAFYIHELKFIGGTASIKPLAEYLNHDKLCSHASIALLSIENSIQGKSNSYFSGKTVTDVFTEALPTAKGKNQLLILKTIGSLNKVPAETVNEIHKYMTVKGSLLKLTAARALANIANPSSAPMLINSIKDETAYNRRKLISYNLLYSRNSTASNKKLGLSHALKTMTVIDRKNEVNSFINALSTLQDIQGAVFTDDLILQLDNTNLRIRAAVADLLVAGSDPEINTKLIKLYSQKDSGFQAQALRVLVQKKNPDASKMLGIALSSKSALVRMTAIKLTAYVEPAGIIIPLVELLQKSEDSKSASLALKRIPGSRSQLLKTYNQASDQSKVIILDILGSQKNTEVAKLLLTAALSPDKAIRKAAFSGLKNIAEFEQIPSFATMLKNCDSSSDRRGFQAAIVTASYSKQDNAAAEVIKVVSNSASSKGNIALIQVLNRIGGKKALRGLLSLHLNGSETVQKETVRTLSKWSSISEFQELILFSKKLEGKNQLLMVRGLTTLIVNSVASKAQKGKQLDQLIGLTTNKQEKQKLLDKKKSLK